MEVRVSELLIQKLLNPFGGLLCASIHAKLYNKLRKKMFRLVSEDSLHRKQVFFEEICCILYLGSCHFNRYH